MVWYGMVLPEKIIIDNGNFYAIGKKNNTNGYWINNDFKVFPDGSIDIFTVHQSKVYVAGTTSSVIHR